MINKNCRKHLIVATRKNKQFIKKLLKMSLSFLTKKQCKRYTAYLLKEILWEIL